MQTDVSVSLVDSRITSSSMESKHFPHEIETALEEALISGATASYCVVYSHRPELSETETYCAVYLPSYDLNDGRARTETADAIHSIMHDRCWCQAIQSHPACIVTVA